jgi:hypothetical protein
MSESEQGHDADETTLKFVAVEETEPKRVAVPDDANITMSGDRYVTTRDYFGRTLGKEAGPQAYLVDAFPPQTTVGAHFHSVDQYQLFFTDGDAFYQRSPMGRVMLHYSDGYKTYGPFGTGSKPISFFTLRPDASAFTAYMPGSRDKMTQKGIRNFHLDLDEILARPLATDTEVYSLVDPPGDGLSSEVVTVGPNKSVTETLPLQASGQYLCVLKGTVEINGLSYGPRSLAWNPAGSGPFVLRAGDQGAWILAMRFPARAVR